MNERKDGLNERLQKVSWYEKNVEKKDIGQTSQSEQKREETHLIIRHDSKCRRNILYAFPPGEKQKIFDLRDCCCCCCLKKRRNTNKYYYYYYYYYYRNDPLLNLLGSGLKSVSTYLFNYILIQGIIYIMHS